ncbi:MAG: hypothetical protein ACT4O0_13855 [Pseudonocardia sp.]|jgi:hypothetical protein
MSVLAAAKQALERFHDVREDDDGTLSFAHAEIIAFVQAAQLEQGLDVLNLNCVVAWDLPPETDVPTRVALGVGDILFGTPRVVRGERGWDVTLRYAFPAAGLEVEPLGTLLMLVVSNASQLRAELLRP